MKCKKCGSSKVIKYGKKLNKQQYGCKDCGHVFIDEGRKE